MRYKYILFDLDGTLTDPMEGITNSVMYALKYFGIQAESRESLFPYIGPPLLESFQKYHGLTPTQAREGLRVYREYFTDKGLLENKVYPGIEDLLQSLMQAGARLFVATSKPEPYSERIVRHFGLDPYFEFVGGSTMDETRVHKEEVIAYVLQRAGIEDRENAVMIGDRDLDILGAKKNGMDGIGVLFGYGSREELTQADAAYLAESPEILKEYLLQ